jgi:hypothetical protein
MSGAPERPITEVEMLQATITNLTHQLAEKEIAEQVRAKAEADAKLPKPDSFELKCAKDSAEREFKAHVEEYRQMAHLEVYPYRREPVPLAAGWPKGYDPIKYVRKFWNLTDDGTALISDPNAKPPEPEPVKSFMDQFRK